MGTAEDARIALLSRLIDHAPMFPPASLDLREAVAEDARARESASSFMLGRFVCPMSRLDELPDVGRGVSVVVDAPFVAEARVEAAEVLPLRDLGVGVRPHGSDPDGLASAPEVYYEVPLDKSLDDRLDQLAELGLRAKVRCGGKSVPDVGELARFVRLCRERGVPFKATAGLHHAVRRDGEHGFLNLLAAVVFGAEEEALAEIDADAFALDEGRFAWRGREAGAGEVAEALRERLSAIGSCSFFEPVEELEALGVLPL